MVVRLMRTVSDMLHRLGAHGVGAHSLSVAINSRSFFEDVSVPWAPPGPPPQRQGGPAGRAGRWRPGELPGCAPEGLLGRPPRGGSSARAQRPAPRVLTRPPRLRAHRENQAASPAPDYARDTWAVGVREQGFGSLRMTGTRPRCPV